MKRETFNFKFEQTYEILCQGNVFDIMGFKAFITNQIKQIIKDDDFTIIDINIITTNDIKRYTIINEIKMTVEYLDTCPIHLWRQYLQNEEIKCINGLI
jgi:hypothetical protein